MKQLFTWFLAFFLTFGSMHAWTVQAKDGADDNQAQDMQDEDEDDADETENDEDEDDADETENDDDEDDATPSLTAETMSDCTMEAQDQVFIDKFSTKLDKVFATWNTEKRMKIKEAMEKMMSKFPEGRVHCLVKALHMHLVKLNESTPAPTTEMSLMDKIKARLAGLLGEK